MRLATMYCVFNATTTYNADQGNPFGWPLEDNYGYFCDQRDKGELPDRPARAPWLGARSSGLD